MHTIYTQYNEYIENIYSHRNVIVIMLIIRQSVFKYKHITDTVIKTLNIGNIFTHNRNVQRTQLTIIHFFKSYSLHILFRNQNTEDDHTKYILLQTCIFKRSRIFRYFSTSRLLVYYIKIRSYVYAYVSSTLIHDC